MLSRLALIITASFVLVCILSPVLLAIEAIFAPPQIVFLNHNGSSIGIHFGEDNAILIRRRGYGPGLDTDAEIKPHNAIVLCTLPPVLWFYAHWPLSALDRQRRRFAKLCIASPFAVLLGLVCIRDAEAVFGLVVAAISTALAIGFVALRHVQWLPSRAVRRISKGLCANCGYDIRATPLSFGPVLPRCPECGTITRIARDRDAD